MNTIERRLLLLEILNTDRYRSYRSQYFPHLAAFLRKGGVETHWVSIGVAANEARAGEQLYVYDLPSVERQKLAGRLEELQPTHVLLNERLEPELFDLLRQQLPDAALRLIDFVDGHGAAVSVGRWLGLDVTALSGSERMLEDEVAPDYARDPINHLATQIKPYVHLNLGPECLYHKSISTNPHFEGLDVSGCIRDRGCSFCLYPDGVERSPATPVVELALSQIDAAERTSHPAMRSREYQVHGAHLWFALDRFAEALADRQLPPSSFHFSARIDEVLALGDRLESALRSMTERGHIVRLYNIGVENFSPAENERFNKGLSRETIARGARRILELEERFPEAFRFTEMGGFGIILFTPWTSVEDLRVNARSFREHGIDASGFALDSTLQLLPRLAITLRAKQDGLLAERFDDFRYDSGCITDWHARDLPWRFAHPEVAMIYAIGRRLSRVADIPPSEPKYACVQAWLQGLPRSGGDVQRVFEALIDVMEERPGERSVVSAMRAIEERLGERSGHDLSLVDEAALERRASFDEVRRDELPSFWEVVAEQVSRLDGDGWLGERLRGFHLEGIRLKRFVDHYGLELDLGRDGVSMRVFVEEASGERRAYLTQQGFSISYAMPSPPDGEQSAVMRTLLAVVSRIAQRSGSRPRAPELDQSQ